MKEKFTIKFKRLHKDAIMPRKATDGSAAYDAIIPKDVYIKNGRQVIPLGWAIEMPENICLDCRARSGYSAKGLLVEDSNGTPLRLNADVTLGLIDSDYRNEIGVILDVKDIMASFHIYKLNAGQAVAQLKFSFVPDTELVECSELSETNRKGGFGHMNGE